MFCNRAKEFLRDKGIRFEELDITRDEAALEELKRLGYMTTPVITVDGETVVGFDRERLERLLA